MLGILGALDPFQYKMNQSELRSELGKDGLTQQPLIELHPASIFHPSAHEANLTTSSEEYYPTVAINALMKILEEPGKDYLLDFFGRGLTSIPISVESCAGRRGIFAIFATIARSDITTPDILCNRRSQNDCK